MIEIEKFQVQFHISAIWECTTDHVLHTWCTPQCTPGAHLVNSDHMVHTQIMNTWCTALLMHSWCTLGAHLVNSLPFWLLSISSLYPSITISIRQSLNPYLFYLYLHINPLIYFTSISISIPPSFLSLSPHISPYLFYLYLHTYPSIYSQFYLYLQINHSIHPISIST